MKNNQFKKLIRIALETSCASKGFQCVYVDYSNNERMTYIYDSVFSPVSTISLYLGDSSVSIKASKNKEKSVSLGNSDASLKCSYLEIKKVFKFITDFLVDEEKKEI